MSEIRGGEAEAELMAAILSNFIFQAFGYSPSQTICQPFAELVLAEAAAAGVGLGDTPDSGLRWSELPPITTEDN